MKNKRRVNLIVANGSSNRFRMGPMVLMYLTNMGYVLPRKIKSHMDLFMVIGL